MQYADCIRSRMPRQTPLPSWGIHTRMTSHFTRRRLCHHTPEFILLILPLGCRPSGVELRDVGSSACVQLAHVHGFDIRCTPFMIRCCQRWRVTHLQRRHNQSSLADEILVLQADRSLLYLSTMPSTATNFESGVTCANSAPTPNRNPSVEAEEILELGRKTCLFKLTSRTKALFEPYSCFMYCDGDVVSYSPFPISIGPVRAVGTELYQNHLSYHS